MRFNGLKTLAFALVLILVGARCLMREILREPPVVVGMEAAPRDALAGVRLVLDGLICLPALLVTLHRALNPTSRIRLPGLSAVFALLAVWAIVSTIWASDRYAAMVASMDLLAAASVFYCGAQCMDGAKRKRWVAALVVGVLAALVGKGIYHRTQEFPEVMRQWNDKESPNSRWAYMKANNLQETDFQFKQFEVRIKSGEIMGFSSSPNGYAAIVAVGLVVLMGVLADHRANGRLKHALAGLIVFPAAFFVLRYTYSKQAMLTPVLGLVGLMLSGILAKRYARSYALGLLVFAGLVGLGIGYGATRGGFPNESLTVRWYYAAGGWEIFKMHPWTGAGWSNFGFYYPAVRGTLATEQVQDPHNFLVRGMTELGIVGALLMVAGFAWGAWEVFKPGQIELEKQGTSQGMKPLAAGVCVGMMVNFLASADFNVESVWLGLSAVGTVGMGIAVLAGMGFVMDGPRETESRWINRGLATGLAVYFIHNLLDFSWSEPGQLCLAALLAGSLVGKPAEASKVPRRGLAFGALGVMGTAWIAVWVAAVWVVIAEQKGNEADAKLRQGYVLAAAERYGEAFEMMGINSDYAFKEGLAWQAGGQLLKAKVALGKAIGANGRLAKYYAVRAGMEKGLEDKTGAAADYGHAVALDPMDLDLGLEHAKTLEWAGHGEEAKKQYQRVLEMDEKLVGAFRRLSEQDREFVKSKLKG